MDGIKSDLIIRLDETGECLCLFTARVKFADSDAQEEKPPLFSIEISLESLRHRGAVEAERLIGKSVLGFFDHLTNGRLNLPKHYLEHPDADES